jgi:hypothetical protein
MPEAAEATQSPDRGPTAVAWTVGLFLVSLVGLLGLWYTKRLRAQRRPVSASGVARVGTVRKAAKGTTR